MYIENGNGVFRLPNRSWSGFCTSLLGKRSNKKNVVRYFGHFDVEDVEHSFSFFAPKPFMELASVKDGTESILFFVYPSIFPIKQIGFTGRVIPLSVETDTWEYELTQRKNHAVHSWIYDTYKQGKRYSFYLPKAMLEDDRPPPRIMIQIAKAP